MTNFIPNSFFFQLPGIEIWLGIGYNFCMNTTNTETNGSTLDLLGQAREIRGKIDEALKKEVQEVGTQSILGLLLSTGAFFFFGWFLYWVLSYVLMRFGIWYMGRMSFGLFLLIYIVVLAVLVAVGMKYRPKESYYVGRQVGRHIADDPFTHRDDRDRSHIALGLLLVIPNFIRLNLDNVRNYLTSRSPIKNSTLAAAILLYAENGRATEEIVETLQPLGFGQTAVKDAIRCLHLVNWIDINQAGESEPTVTLTEKAKDILTERGIWVGIFEPKTPPGFSETT